MKYHYVLLKFLFFKLMAINNLGLKRERKNLIFSFLSLMNAFLRTIQHQVIRFFFRALFRGLRDVVKTKCDRRSGDCAK
jgi:hypothetical protein